MSGLYWMVLGFFRSRATADQPKHRACSADYFPDPLHSVISFQPPKLGGICQYSQVKWNVIDLNQHHSSGFFRLELLRYRFFSHKKVYVIWRWTCDFLPSQQGKSICATSVLINTTRVTALKKSLKSLQQTQNGVFRYNTSLPLAGSFLRQSSFTGNSYGKTYLSQ